MKKRFIFLIFFVVLLFVSLCGLCGYIVYKAMYLQFEKPHPEPPIVTGNGSNIEIKKFSSKEELVIYLQENQNTNSYSGFGGGGFIEDDLAFEMGDDNAIAPSTDESRKLAARVSETNVQVVGIDEPDIVKTDGTNIFYSSEAYWMYYDYPREPNLGNTQIINAFPPKDLQKVSEIAKSGDLLLTDNKLVVSAREGIYAYDIGNISDPPLEWKYEVGENDIIDSVRLFGDKIYLVIRRYADYTNPCPIVPVLEGKSDVYIRCTDIYYPNVNVSADSTYTIVKVDATSGDVDEQVSFIGSSGSSVVYMSPNSIYVSYSYYMDMMDFVVEFFSESSKDLVPDEVIAKLKKLSSYDISNTSKLTEFYMVLDRWQNTLDDDERVQVENELTNRMDDYFNSDKMKEYERTGITKVSVDSLQLEATGSIPGSLLNQFSFDEYQGYLRVATTTGNNIFTPFGSSSKSFSDVYVLDTKLQIVGGAYDMGKGERIYSARFIGDKGYVVTFRQTDPFYVLDLSSPKNPAITGELKIPGFSSYLHPLEENLILGVGQEGSSVKISLFDVSDSKNPIEKDKYLMSEYWSEISYNHHAFLQDSKHKIFFIPAGNGGYVFSYENSKIEMKKAVSGYEINRALFLDNYLYMIGSRSITVLDEKTWEEVSDFEMN